MDATFRTGIKSLPILSLRPTTPAVGGHHGPSPILCAVSPTWDKGTDLR
jgi:hypothetical protein